MLSYIVQLNYRKQGNIYIYIYIYIYICQRKCITFGTQYKYLLFLISNFRLILQAVFLLLGDSPASEFHVPTFQNNVCSFLIGGVSKKYPMKMEQCSETSAHKFKSRRTTQSKEYKKYLLLLFTIRA